MSRECETSNL